MFDDICDKFVIYFVMFVIMIVVGGVKKMFVQVDSIVIDVVGFKVDFNVLFVKLRIVGIVL